jgi:histone deacetylase 11
MRYKNITDAIEKVYVFLRISVIDLTRIGSRRINLFGGTLERNFLHQNTVFRGGFGSFGKDAIGKHVDKGSNVDSQRLISTFWKLLAASAIKKNNYSVPSISTMASSTDLEAKRTERIFSSKLYMDVSPSKVPVIYSSSYNISFMGLEKLHPFDSSKWGRICQFLISEGVLDHNRLVEPSEANKDDLLVVHTESYLDSLKSSSNIAFIIEVPPVALLPNFIVRKRVLQPFCKQVGGTVLAGKLAKERGWAINLGGGFHHCSKNKGGGFCVYADISLCIQFAFAQLGISKVMIIDLDAHQGNGHEMDFAHDGRVYILDMYNSEIYPLDYAARTCIQQRVELLSGASTKEYLERLDKELEVAQEAFDPELIIYNAGTDILNGDPLGRLKVDPDGVIKRDEKVFAFAQQKKVPIVMLTSGGYMKSSARVIANSIINLSNKHLIELNK